jgi:hypothetical protein
MRARGWVVAGVLGVGVATAGAEPKPTPVDIKGIKSKLVVLQDALGGTYVVLPIGSGVSGQVFYGPGKTLYTQVVIGGSRDDASWTISTWAPRIADIRPGTIQFKADGTYFKSCDGKDDAELGVITGDKAKVVLDKYAFVTSGIIHVPHLFARDDTGVYYYVDRLAKAYGGNGYRVFVGRKGAMKAMSLTDVASDSVGQVFSTRTGDLRLVRTTEDSAKAGTTWIKGEKRTELIKLDVDVNSPVIFRELGIYKFTGTICDNI